MVGAWKEPAAVAGAEVRHPRSDRPMMVVQAVAAAMGEGGARQAEEGGRRGREAVEAMAAEVVARHAPAFRRVPTRARRGPEGEGPPCLHARGHVYGASIHMCMGMERAAARLGRTPLV